MIRLGLDSMRALLETLSHPEETLKFIHIAGTNGKGSVSAFLRYILTAAGYLVGTYNSPAVFSREEQYLLGHEAIAPEELAQLSTEVEEACQCLVEAGQLEPTAFEKETAIAFLYFQKMKCDFVILEVGLGGDGDATNVISTSLCSVFTSIGRDHMKFLGNSLAEIAEKKVGILKANGTAISIWQESEVEEVLRARASECGAQLTFADAALLHPIDAATFSYKGITAKLSMEGSYQVDNATLAIEVAFALREQGVAISDTAIETGLAITKWQGRMECIRRHPFVYLDGCHNVPAARRIAETLKARFTNERIIYIMGVLADKEYEAMLDILLPFAWRVYTVTPDNLRALDAHRLAKAVCARAQMDASCENVKETGEHCDDSKLRPMGIPCESMEEAAQAALSDAPDMILVLGSLSFLGDIKPYLKED